MTEQSTPDNERAGSVQPSNPPPPPNIGKIDSPQRWYENTALVIASLFLCCLPSIALVWIKRQWKKSTKVAITSVAVIGYLGFFAIGMFAPENPVDVATTSETRKQQTTTTTPVEETTTSTVPESTTTTTVQATTTTSEQVTATTILRTCATTPASDSFNSKSQDLYRDRAGISERDHEARLGDCVRIIGYTTYANDPFVEDFPPKIIVVNIGIQNRDSKSKQFSRGQFSLQSPQGGVSAPTVSLFGNENGPIESGWIDPGGTVLGGISFYYRGAGTYYLFWNPTGATSDRGVWGFEVP